MYKYTYLIILLLTLGNWPNLLYSQQKATISFQLVDEESDEPMGSATVKLFSLPDSNLLGGILTDTTGRGNFTGITPGNYQVVATYIGYSPAQSSVLVGRLNQFYDLGKMYLTPTGAQLSEVIIEGEKATVATTLDKKSFSMDENISQAGGSALDAMRSLPGITVDSEGKVSLRGSDQVSILIDGQQSSLTGFGNQQGLENIPASNIDRIEIINNPSAKYDASGMAGIINIVYKKEKQKGLKGDLGFTLGLGELTTRKADLPTELGRFSVNPKYIPSLSLNYTQSKWKAFPTGRSITAKKVAQQRIQYANIRRWPGHYFSGSGKSHTNSVYSQWRLGLANEQAEPVGVFCDY